MEYPEFVTALAKPLPTSHERVDHALLGLIGELGEFADAWKKSLIYKQEFDRINAIEELGDLSFYAQMLQNEGLCLDASRTAEEIYTMNGLIFRLSTSIGAFTHAHMEDDPDRFQESQFDFDGLFSDINDKLEDLIYGMNMTVEEVQRLNMEKLTKRYPDKVYTDAHAAERLDKIEEGKV